MSVLDEKRNRCVFPPSFRKRRALGGGKMVEIDNQRSGFFQVWLANSFPNQGWYLEMGLALLGRSSALGALAHLTCRKSSAQLVPLLSNVSRFKVSS